MPKVEITIEGKDKFSGEMKKITAATDDFNAELERLVKQQKQGIIADSALTQFKQMTDAEKDAFLAARDLEAQQDKVSAASSGAGFSMTELNSAVSLAKQGFELLAKAQAATVDVSVQYANEVRSLNEVNGQSAEANSRLIQVLDDHKISLQDLITTQKELNKDGKTMTVEFLADVADKYNAATNQVDKNKIAQDALGRSWRSYIELLDLGREKLLAESAAVDDALILTQKQIDAARKYEMALDNLQDKQHALSVEFGNIAIPVESRMIDMLTDLVSITSDVARTADLAWGTWDEGIEIIKRFLALRVQKGLEEQKNATDSATASYIAMAEAYSGGATTITASEEEIAAAAKSLSDTLSSQVSLINSMQSAEDNYAKRSADLTTQRTEAEAKLADLRRQGYWEQSSQVQDAIKKVDDLKNKEAELTAEYERQALVFVSGILQQNLARDGWTQAEFDAFAKQQEAWGLWSADVVQKSQAAWQEAQKITDAINAIPSNKTIDIYYRQYGNVGNNAQTQAGGYAYGYATGTNFSPGGMSWVGERGPELVNLPTGSQVYSNSQSMQMMTQQQAPFDYARMARAFGDELRKGGG